MKARCLFSIILVCFFSLGCNQRQYAQAQLDRLKQAASDSDNWDFGKVREGEVLQHDFILKNESPKTLNISEVNTSCGCTASKVAKKTLLPGEETSIEVKFNSKGYAGPVQQFVYVHTDSLDKPIIRYIIKAEVFK